MGRIRISGRLTTARAWARFAGPVRAGVLRRSRGPGWVGSVAVLAGVLAAFGVPGAWQSVAVASSSPVLNWTRQAPAASPSPRNGASVAYDAATGNVVLFGGEGRAGRVLGDTWVWDGATWAKQAPATSPPARWGASMAYDAATGNVVLFGGASRSGSVLPGTWVWDGATWAKQAPATSPPAREDASMAYDAATGNVVLFGGFSTSHFRVLGDTWAWNGVTWAKQAPATSPPARDTASMAYDAATGNVVLFGGIGQRALGDTWVWNGATWVKQHPVTSPPALRFAAMAYDAATGNVVLFGGEVDNTGRALNGTWVWDGATWAKQAPTTSPPPRLAPSMAYDAATGNVVLFGGFASIPLGDTWVWGSG